MPWEGRYFCRESLQKVTTVECERTNLFPSRKQKKRTSPPHFGLPFPPKSSGRNVESSSKLPPYPPPFRTLSLLPPVAHTNATMCAPGPAANRHFFAPMAVRRSTTSCRKKYQGLVFVRRISRCCEARAAASQPQPPKKGVHLRVKREMRIKLRSPEPR